MTTTTNGRATARRAARQSADSSRHPLAGTATLVRFMLRRDRIRLLSWSGGLGLFVLYLVTALPTLAETEDDLAATTQLYTEPVGRLLTGPGYGFDEPTFERFAANGYGLYFLIIAAIMSILLVVRHTRVEEQTGRAELVRANVVGRHALLSATMIMAVITNVVVSVVVAVLMIAVGGYGTAGSVLFAAGIAATGLAFAGVAVITVQLSQYSRVAASLAGAVLGLAFVLRAGGDMADAGGTVLSWSSPLAWAQQTAPFVLDRWWPLLLTVGLAVVTAAIGAMLSGRRDLGASFVAVRPGRDRAAPHLGTPLGLAWRLQRASIVGWTIALAVAGLIFGAYADSLLDAMGDLPEELLDVLGADDIVGGYLALIVLFMALLAAAFALLAVHGWRDEETSGRAEPVLATPVSRTIWLGVNAVVTAAGVIFMLAVAGLATGIGAAAVTSDASHIGQLTAASLNQASAVLVVLGLAIGLFGAFPRMLGLSWVVIGYGLIVGMFATMLDLPEGALRVSPFDHAAQMPVETFELLPVVVLTVIAVAAAAVGLVAYRRRGINVA